MSTEYLVFTKEQFENGIDVLGGPVPSILRRAIGPPVEGVIVLTEDELDEICSAEFSDGFIEGRGP